MELISVPVRRPDELEGALKMLTRKRPDALIVHQVASIWEGIATIVEFALKNACLVSLGSVLGQTRGF